MPQSGPEAAAGSGGKPEQQLKRRKRRAAAEADAIGEQLCAESSVSGAGLRTVYANEGKVAERAKRAQLLVILLWLLIMSLL